MAMFKRSLVLTDCGVLELRDLFVGDRVWNGSSYMGVKNVFVQESNDVRMINAGKGNVIKCTADHIFYINNKKVFAGDIKSGDKLDNIADTCYTDTVNIDTGKVSESNAEKLKSETFAVFYGLYIVSCKNNDRLLLNTYTTPKIGTLLSEQIFSALNLPSRKIDDYTFEFNKNDISGLVEDFRMSHFQYASNDVFKKFLLGILYGRGYVKLSLVNEYDKKFDFHFSTNNERIAYGIQFELFRRFNIRMSVRLSTNFSSQKVFKCTIIGSDKFLKHILNINECSDMINLFAKENVTADGLIEQQEFIDNEVIFNKVMNKPIYVSSVELLDKEATVPTFGYIKTNL
jgi:hypothetical protein